jgi:hypothetical protein
MITLDDLKARMVAVKAAPMFSKAQAAELALTDFLQYLAAQDARIAALETKGAGHGNGTV